MGCRLFTCTNVLCCSLKRLFYHPVTSSRAYFDSDGSHLRNAPFEGVHTNASQNEDNNKKKGKESKATNKKRLAANVVTPPLGEQRRKEVQSVVGLHLGPSAVYWAKIEREGDVVDWNHKELFPIAEFSRKIQLPKLYEVIYFLLESIPFSDAYVLEGSIQGVQGSLAPPPSATATSIMRSQIVAMLVALLNSRPEVEQDSETPEEELEYFHKVYLLKPRLMSRLFHLLVGTERVSALTLVDSILDERGSLPPLSISEIMGESKMGEECHQRESSSNKPAMPLYTPIRTPSSIIESYRLLRAVEREAMSQSLLLAMAFYDLVIFKDPKILGPLQLQ